MHSAYTIQGGRVRLKVGFQPLTDCKLNSVMLVYVRRRGGSGGRGGGAGSYTIGHNAAPRNHGNCTFCYCL